MQKNVKNLNSFKKQSLSIVSPVTCWILIIPVELINAFINFFKKINFLIVSTLNSPDATVIYILTFIVSMLIVIAMGLFLKRLKFSVKQYLEYSELVVSVFGLFSMYLLVHIIVLY